LKHNRDKYDLILIGGGLSATFLCLSIFKLNPKFKILIIEKSATFPKKVGESIIDLTSLYIKTLNIDHILDQQKVKSGVRYLFNESNSTDLSLLSEFASPTRAGFIKGYHVNRSTFDQDLLNEVIKKGVTVLRPANIVKLSCSDFKTDIDIECNTELNYVTSKWIVDASGRSRYIPTQLNWTDKQTDLNTGAITAHFKNCAPSHLWDTPKNEVWNKTAIGDREFSTTHLLRKNSWWWIIKLDDNMTSIGVVFDNNKVKFDDYESHFKTLLETDSQLSIITKGAEISKVKHFESLPYVSDKIHTKGIALIGESGAFLDPLLAPGIELISQQTIWLANLLTEDKKTGVYNKKAWNTYSTTFQKAYQSRLKIYESVYHFIDSYDIFTTFLKQGNYVYFGWLIYPSVLSKKRLKYPLILNKVERLALTYFSNRFIAIREKRTRQNRISNTTPHTISYSGVGVPKSIAFLYIPIRLLFKSVFSYLKLELTELTYLFKK
jgi:flavin-dependent dehydrogenase